MKTLFPSLLITLFLLSGNADARNLLQYREVIDVSNHKGSTFLTLMKGTIKPALDKKAKEGFRVADGKTVGEAIRNVDKKVAKNAIEAAGSPERLKSLADRLNREYDQITFTDLPAAIAKAGFSKGRYDLTTFLSLVSEGGVAVKFDENNISYNVNYGTGENQDDERSGRSFGESADRLALDASDKHYLETLEAYVRSDKENARNFYRTILRTLLNSDTSGFDQISEAGQAVATDFLAVYIAEQDRHLMSGLRSHPWDEALLEVTLLSAFHSGQSKVMVMYNGELTDTTYQQTTGCSASSNRRKKAASMVDYWQFSSSTDPSNCSRSGINITRKEFRALGAKITAFQRAANPQLVSRIERSLRVSRSKNILADLSSFLINRNAPARLDANTLKLADDLTELLMSIQDQADTATLAITSGKL